MKLLATIFVMCAWYAPAIFSQINITYTDLQTQYAQGKYISTLVAPVPRTYTVRCGLPSSAAQQFDFQSIPFVLTETRKVVSIDSTPYMRDFNMASFALSTSKVDSMFQYFLLTDTAFAYLGQGARNSAPEVILLNPVQVLSVLPLRMGSYWLYDPPAVVNPSFTIKQVMQHTVDAFGTLTTPDGAFECLRTRRLKRVAIESPNFNSVNRELTYLYLTKEGYGIELIVDTLDEQLGQIIPIEIFYHKPGKVAVSVDPARTPSARNVTLAQNYPNPVPAREGKSTQTHFLYTVTERSQIRLTLYDALGRKVRVLAEGQVEAGEHIVGTALRLTPGIYFYTLETWSRDDRSAPGMLARKLAVVR